MAATLAASAFISAASAWSVAVAPFSRFDALGGVRIFGDHLGLVFFEDAD